jgi:hypothetical protein
LKHKNLKNRVPLEGNSVFIYDKYGNAVDFLGLTDMEKYGKIIQSSSSFDNLAGFCGVSGLGNNRKFGENTELHKMQYNA